MTDIQNSLQLVPALRVFKAELDTITKSVNSIVVTNDEEYNHAMQILTNANQLSKKIKEKSLELQIPFKSEIKKIKDAEDYLAEELVKGIQAGRDKLQVFADAKLKKAQEENAKQLEKQKLITDQLTKISKATEVMQLVINAKTIEEVDAIWNEYISSIPLPAEIEPSILDQARSIIGKLKETIGQQKAYILKGETLGQAVIEEVAEKAQENIAQAQEEVVQTLEESKAVINHQIETITATAKTGMRKNIIYEVEDINKVKSEYLEVRNTPVQNYKKTHQEKIEEEIKKSPDGKYRDPNMPGIVFINKPTVKLG